MSGELNDGSLRRESAFVQVIGEIRAGIAKAFRQRELHTAGLYERWPEALLQYENRVIDFDSDPRRFGETSC